LLIAASFLIDKPLTPARGSDRWIGNLGKNGIDNGKAGGMSVASTLSQITQRAAASGADAEPSRPSLVNVDATVREI
jgi:hypothetical protein